MTVADLEQALAEARPEAIEREVVAAALAATGATIGALFVWDKKARGLVLSHHRVEGLDVTLPDRVIRSDDRPGIAGWAFEHDAPHLCRDSASDPHYTRYLLDVRAIAAKVPRARQTLLFSATMPPDVAGLADAMLVDPAKVSVTPRKADAATVELLEERLSAWGAELDHAAGRPVSTEPGAGAAGGLGAALLALGGRRESGAAIIAEFTGPATVSAGSEAPSFVAGWATGRSACRRGAAGATPTAPPGAAADCRAHRATAGRR